MLFIVAMSGLMGFVAGVRMRLVPLILLAAIVACGAGAGAAAVALSGWTIVLSIVLAVTAFELAALAALTMRAGLSRSVAKSPETSAKRGRPSRAGAAALH